MAKHGGLVYSSSGGATCPRCRRPVAACRCPAKASTPVGDGRVRVGRATQGRKGKGVTTVTGLPLGPAELAQLGKALKQLCGSGGTVKAGVVEIQGDHRDRIVAWLAERGHDVKRAGG